jgi:CxxC-x17-CxxC domain-containing protein
MPLTVTEETILCRDCSEPFVFTVAEQRFYAERALKRPVCCPECRAARRAERNAEAIRAADGGSTTPASEGFGNYAGFTGGGGGAKRLSRTAPLMMHTAICASCGRQTEVPFVPRGNRPVYCRACFNTRRGR